MKLSMLLTKCSIAASGLAMVFFAASNAMAQDAPSNSTPATTVPSPALVAPTTTSAVGETDPSPFTVRDLPSTKRVSAINRPLLITGTLLLAGTWGTSIGFAYGSPRAEDQKYLYYPVAGPWLDLAHRDCSARPCTNEDFNKGLLIADGIGQGLGALAIVTSLFFPERTTKHWPLIGSDKSVVGGPMRVGTGYGMGALGRF